jgi:site-specific DNA-methyltransferase (adenine-specific)
MENSIYNEDCIIGLSKIKDESIDLIITDPPYGVNYGEKSKFLSKMGKSRDKQITRDSCFADQHFQYHTLMLHLFRVLKNNSHLYIFCGDKQIRTYISIGLEIGFSKEQILVWKKPSPTFDMTFGLKFMENKEFIIFMHKGHKKLNTWSAERHLFRSVLEFESSKDTDYHSCAKPIRLIQHLIKLSSIEGDIILDPFAGSGNHLIAAKRLKRGFIGFEKENQYYQSILKRLEFENQQKTLNEMEG